MPAKLKHECDPQTRCRVKEIQRVYNVNIPLQIFQELNVASCWTDWVDRRDIELAMQVQRVEEHKHDIDMQ